MKYLCLAYESEADLAGLAHDEWLRLRQETLDYVARLERNGQLVDPAKTPFSDSQPFIGLGRPIQQGRN
ncbi:hypothetical protein EZI54_23350 [Marinobacter halodurans]|uniref:YciI family protein n=1 Tax=Marinobacter halodurans TaxID=2528979 RepID=A0ABY1ZDV0_9GAMM|nr:hypothetical protein [Marinobacter halodurans]TBW45979.1 hypothetical protein EZI54_23350 [Marinobacter halodurans]